jgi:hypothetical protein
MSTSRLVAIAARLVELDAQITTIGDDPARTAERRKLETEVALLSNEMQAELSILRAARQGLIRLN